MRFGLTLIPTDMGNYVTWVREAEAAGFDYLGVPDTQASLYRECYVCLSMLASNTRRVLAGPLVTNPLTRHPAVTASAIATADEISGGRIVLTIATGDSAVRNLGLKVARLQFMEEYVHALRGLFTGEEITYQGNRMRLRWAKRQIPIYIAGEGPASLRLAGRIGDGAVVGMGLLPEVVTSALSSIREGAEEAGRKLEDVDVWFMARASLGEEMRATVQFLRPSLAAAANHNFRFTLEGKGLPPELHEPVHRLMRGYDVHFHSDSRADNPNTKLLDELGLTEYMARRFAIVGTEADCIDQLKAARAAGVTGLIVRPLVRDNLEFIRHWRTVMQAVRGPHL